MNSCPHMQKFSKIGLKKWMSSHHLLNQAQVYLMKINKFITNKHQSQSFEETYYFDLFQKLVQNFPKARNLNDTIDLYLLYKFFSYYRIDKSEARRIMREWESRRWSKLVQFHGIKILRQ